MRDTAVPASCLRSDKGKVLFVSEKRNPQFGHGKTDRINSPDRMKVADVLLHYGKDLNQSRLGLIRSPFRDERTPSFHILSNGYAWKDFGDGSVGR